MYNYKGRKKIIFSFIFISISLFSFLSNPLHAQKLKTLLADGDKSFADRDFFGASIYYNQAILKDSGNIAIQYKYAEASRLNFDYDVAYRWYYKAYNQDPQGKLYPECTFWIASLKKIRGNYVEAKKMFDRYAKKNKKKKNDYFVKKAIQEVAACDYAALLSASPDRNINIIHLDSSVNSKVSEYAPIEVDSLLYFSSLRNGTDKDKKNHLNYNKIYTSVQDNSKWRKATELDTLFNKEGIHNANTAFNADVTKVYITRCEQKNSLDFSCEIYFSDYKNGRWKPLQKLPSEINEKGYTNTQPAVGFLGDEEVLFFASDRPGGEGKMDIWYSKINKDGSYGKAINAGKKINSLDDEITPFYCKPCQELFFSSTWHKGFGGFDIFKSKYKNNEFSEPENLGLPINSCYNDIYFSINSSRTEAFLSSNREGSFFEEKESCCNDIYMFKIPGSKEPPKKVDTTPVIVAQIIPPVPKYEPPVKIDSARIIVAQMKLLVPLTLYFHNDEPDKKTLAITTNKNYKKTYEDYSAMRNQYKREYSKGLNETDAERANKKIDALFNDSVDAGMHGLEKFAKLLLKVLKDSEKVNITIKGYCSPLASSDYNINLAKRRISSLHNYFKEYQNGVLIPYINNTDGNEGCITFFDEDIGELTAPPNVSDDYNDTRNSIYNPAAALQRKIKIIAISSVSSKQNFEKAITLSIPDTIKPKQNRIETPIATSIKEVKKETPKIIQDTDKPKQNKIEIPIAASIKEVKKETPKNIQDTVKPKQNKIETPIAASIKEVKKEIPKNIQDTIKPKQNKIETPVASSTKEVKKETPKNIPSTTKPKEIPITSEQGIFAIQVRLHSQFAKAQATQSSLKKAIKQPIVIVNEGGVFKVRISGFITHDEAKAMLPKLHELGFTDAFIVSPASYILNKKELPSNIQTTTITPESANNKEVPAITKHGDFAVQVRVHGQLVKAQATQSSLKKAIKQPVVIVNEGGVFKVRISGFNTHDEAKAMLPKLNELGFTDAFIVSPE